MKVEDLKSLSLKIVAYVEKQKVDQYFQQFFNILKQTLHGNRPQPVSQQKEELFTSLRSFDQVSLTYSEDNLFHLLAYGSFVGRKAVNEIDAILHDEHFDPEGVLEKIDHKLTEFRQFIEKNRTIASALQRLPSLKETTLREGEALLEITFTDKASIDNMVDFEEWIDSWTKIIRAFSQLVGERPESSRIVFAQKSSPLIIDLATACGLVIVLGQAVDAVLARVERYLQIRKQVEEIRKLKLENKQIEKSLLEEADAFSEKSSHEIAETLSSKVKPKPSGEVVNGVSLAIKSLFVFVDKGGRVDCPSATDDKQPDDMANTFKEVRKLQQSVDRLRLLPASVDETDDAASK